MSIVYNEEQRIFSLTTAHHLYQMQVAEGGVLLHLYYGPITGADMSYLVRMADRGFSGNPYEQRSNRHIHKTTRNSARIQVWAEFPL